jgi:hypothetical protein
MQQSLKCCIYRIPSWPPRHFYKGNVGTALMRVQVYRGDAKRQLHREIGLMCGIHRLQPVFVVDEAHWVDREMIEEVRFLLNFKMEWSDMNFNLEPGSWFVVLEGGKYMLHCREWFDLCLSETRSIAFRLEFARYWYVIMGNVRLNLRSQDTYKIEYSAEREARFTAYTSLF